mgnify:CR=1 FL=1
MSFAIDQDAQPIYKEFRKLADRENKKINELLTEVVADYVKKHGEGNPTFQLDKWVLDPKFRGFPTLGEDPYKWDIRALSEKELKELKARVWVWDEAIRQASHNVKRRN